MRGLQCKLPVGIFLIVGLIHSTLQAIGQNCDADFPGIARRNFSATCGGSTQNLELGKNIYMGEGDIFTFDAPAMINITGNLTVDAQGNGKIVIPAGVTVNISGNFKLDPKNSGCSSANPCTFEIEVNGTLNLLDDVDNSLVTIIWTGTGSVDVDDNFKNSNNGCMTCGPGGCPRFDVNRSKCDDNGSGCSNADFCATIANPCAFDNTAPVFASCPGNQVVSMLGPACTQVASWTPPTVTENCTLSSVIESHTPGSVFLEGITTVTYNATDAAGNTSTCSFTIMVVDNILPVISSCPSDVTVNANASCQAIGSWTAPTFADNCQEGTLTSNRVPGSIFNTGTTIITYTATDAAGNMATCSFNVNVVDYTLPEITGCPADITINANASCQAVVNWTEPVVADNCKVITFISSHTPGATFQIGKTEVKYIATDERGNVSVCVFDVTVANEIVPVISDCPSDISLQGDGESSAIANWIMPSASAPCGEVTLVGSHKPGDLFTIGTTKVEYKAVDNTGNTSYCNFNVIVFKTEIEIDISKVITPDGDGVNDEWILKNIDKFKDNRVVVVDRWGGVVFKGSNYNNQNVVWQGTNRSGETVPTGTYFYTISVRYGADRIEKSGFVELVR